MDDKSLRRHRIRWRKQILPAYFHAPAGTLSTTTASDTWQLGTRSTIFLMLPVFSPTSVPVCWLAWKINIWKKKTQWWTEKSQVQEKEKWQDGAVVTYPSWLLRVDIPALAHHSPGAAYLKNCIWTKNYQGLGPQALDEETLALMLDLSLYLLTARACTEAKASSLASLLTTVLQAGLLPAIQFRHQIGNK